MTIKNLKLNKLKILGCCALLLFLGANFAWALELIYPRMPNPTGYETGRYPQGLDLETIAGRGDIVGFILYIFIFGLIISGLAALAMFTWAGVQWLTSAGNPGKQSDAKDRITKAVLGMLLLLGSYILLSIISPDLIRLGFGRLSLAKFYYCYERTGDLANCYAPTRQSLCTTEYSADPQAVWTYEGEPQCGTGKLLDVWCPRANIIPEGNFNNQNDCEKGGYRCVETAAAGQWTRIVEYDNCVFEEPGDPGNYYREMGQFYAPIALPKFGDASPITVGVILYNDANFLGAKTANFASTLSTLIGFPTYEPQRDGSYTSLPNSSFTDAFKPSSIRVAPDPFQSGILQWGAILFGDTNFNKNSPSVLGEGVDANDVEPVCEFVDKSKGQLAFNDTASSITVFAPTGDILSGGEEIWLYEDINFSASGAGKVRITGSISDLRLLRFDNNRTVSSTNLLGVTADELTSLRIVGNNIIVLVFDEPDFKGRCLAISPRDQEIAELPKKASGGLYGRLSTSGNDWVTSIRVIKYDSTLGDPSEIGISR